jgi:fibronectin-binding autotransporter adhesin
METRIRIQSILALAAILGVALPSAGASVFTYANSGDWTNPVTWGNPPGGAVPGIGDTVRINAGATLNVQESHEITDWIAGGANAKNFFNTGGSAATLKVTGSINFSQATSTFRPSAGAGALTLDLNIVTLTGNAVVNFGNTTTRIEKVAASGLTSIGSTAALNVVATTTESQFGDVEVNGIFRVYNNNDATQGGVSVAALRGTGTTAAASAGADTDGTLTINGASGTASYGGFLTNGSAGATLAVVKEGSGTQVFSGSGDYTGTTEVNVGTLIVNGDFSAATGAVTVASGATLAGSGTIGGATTINGTHNPGNSPGIQSFASGLTYNNGATVNWELADNTEAGRGVNFDGINVSGGLAINGTATINLVFDAGSDVLWENAFWNTDRSWFFYDSATAPMGTFTLGSVGADSLGNTLDPSRGAFSLQTSGNDVFIVYTAVPEPQTIPLFGLSGLALLVWRARRRTTRLKA